MLPVISQILFNMIVSSPKKHAGKPSFVLKPLFKAFCSRIFNFARFLTNQLFDCLALISSCSTNHACLLSSVSYLLVSLRITFLSITSPQFFLMCSDNSLEPLELLNAVCPCKYSFSPKIVLSKPVNILSNPRIILLLIEFLTHVTGEDNIILILKDFIIGNHFLDHSLNFGKASTPCCSFFVLDFSSEYSADFLISVNKSPIILPPSAVEECSIA